MNEQQYRDAAEKHGLQPISFHPPEPPEGLQGCTGIARVGLCIRCDRLYIGGPQIAPQAKRAGTQGVYACAEQVIGGVHVASVSRDSGVDLSLSNGGEHITTPAIEGVPA